MAIRPKKKTVRTKTPAQPASKAKSRAKAAPIARAKPKHKPAPVSDVVGHRVEHDPLGGGTIVAVRGAEEWLVRFDSQREKLIHPKSLKIR
jgi:hypothetical protein